MKKENWIWMPHVGHLIVGQDCRFHLNTYVGGYIVSTLGEYWPDRTVREVHAKVYDPAWLAESAHLKGDNFDSAYMEKFGYEEIGAGRKYETLVFQAGKSTNSCCLYTPASWTEIDYKGYNRPEDAYKGHLELCKKWTNK